jgi:hypothetical protein
MPSKIFSKVSSISSHPFNKEIKLQEKRCLTHRILWSGETRTHSLLGLQMSLWLSYRRPWTLMKCWPSTCLNLTSWLMIQPENSLYTWSQSISTLLMPRVKYLSNRMPCKIYSSFREDSRTSTHGRLSSIMWCFRPLMRHKSCIFKRGLPCYSAFLPF